MTANKAWLPELGVVHVAAPCPARWEQMKGDGQVRFCGACKLNVFNLSEMTAAQARQQINSTEERLCVRFWVRPDGRMLTRDCPIGLAARVRKRVVSLVAAFASLLVGVGLLADAPPDPEQPASATPLQVATQTTAAKEQAPDWIEARRRRLGPPRSAPAQGRILTIGIIRTGNAAPTK